MSTVVIGGGPRPQARIVQVSELTFTRDESGIRWAANVPSYEIRDGVEVLATLKSQEHAMYLLKILQEGE